MELVGNEPQAENKLTPEEIGARKEMMAKIAEEQERRAKSEAELNMRFQINGVATHLYGAMMNGLVSKGASWEEIEDHALYNRAFELAKMVYKHNESYVNEGRERNGEEVTNVIL